MKELKELLEPPVTLGLLMALGYAPQDRAGQALQPAAQPRDGGYDQCSWTRAIRST